MIWNIKIIFPNSLSKMVLHAVVKGSVVKTKTAKEAAVMFEKKSYFK